jgi:carbon monoxide dehydrogenase subunit G
MTTRIEKTVEVDQPVRVVFDQWTQFEEFPEFMSGVSSVTQLTDRRLHWVAEIAGVRREWDAEILEQVPDERITWAATEGATNAGAVYFTSLGAARTAVRLELEYAPEGIVEQIGDKLHIVEKQAEGDLERFKTFIESRAGATGAWRGEVDTGSVGTPTIEDAAASEGTSGKAGLSTTAKVAGAAVAAAGAAAAAAVIRSGHPGDAGEETTDAESAAPTQALPMDATVEDVEVLEVVDAGFVVDGPELDAPPAIVVDDPDVVTFDAAGQSLTPADDDR